MHRPALTAALFLASALAAHGALVTLRPWRHDGAYVWRYVKAQQGKAYNHANVGVTEDPLEVVVPDGWHPNERRVKLGEGRDVYEEAVANMRRWKMLEGCKWAAMFLNYEGAEGPIPKETSLKGTLAATQAKCYGVLWSLNPVRVVYDVVDAEAGGMVYSAIAFSTLRGHLLRGEERFGVELHENGEVYFELRSVSTGSGPWPVRAALLQAVKPLQKRFFTDQAATMQRLVGEGSAGAAQA